MNNKIRTGVSTILSSVLSVFMAAGAVRAEERKPVSLSNDNVAQIALSRYVSDKLSGADAAFRGCVGDKDKQGRVRVNPKNVSDIRNSIFRGYDSRPTIVLDLGHGEPIQGDVNKPDDGAKGNGVKETEIIDAFGMEVFELMKEKGYDVFLTRPPLKEKILDVENYGKTGHTHNLHWRAEATRNIAEVMARPNVVMISVHANSFVPPKGGGTGVNGTEIYYYRDAFTHEGDSPNSKDLAESVARSFNIRGLPSKTLQRSFAVLRCQSSETASILAEIGYLSNPGDAAAMKKIITDPEFRRSKAETFVGGVTSFLNEKGWKPQNVIQIVEAERPAPLD